MNEPAPHGDELHTNELSYPHPVIFVSPATSSASVHRRAPTPKLLSQNDCAADAPTTPEQPVLPLDLAHTCLLAPPRGKPSCAQALKHVAVVGAWVVVVVAGTVEVVVVVVA
jgi:hypothetical protein